MSEALGEPLSSFLFEADDGRSWRIDDFGPGRLRATDIMSPTGYSEWIDRERLYPKPRLPRWADVIAGR